MTGPVVLFRVDAGPGIGLGHLQRSLSLATAVRHLGGAGVFLTNDAPEIRDWVVRHGFPVFPLGARSSWGPDDLAMTSTVAAARRCGGIVVDSDFEGPGYLDALCQRGFWVAAIEDLAPHPFPCHLVVNGDMHALQLHYGSPRDDTVFLLGAQYSILREEFWRVKPRLTSTEAHHVLVFFGGADPYNLSPRILSRLMELPDPLELTVVVGPFSRGVEGVHRIAEGKAARARVVVNPESVLPLMLSADLAVSAGGQTLYELACAGCPTVAVTVAANQEGQVAVFAQAGFLRNAGHGADGGVIEEVARCVRELLADAPARMAMSAAGRALIDGQGAVRVARHLVEHIPVAAAVPSTGRIEEKADGR